MIPGGGVGYEVFWLPTLTLELMKWDFLEYLDKVVPLNTVPQPMDGVRNMAAYRGTLSVALPIKL